MPKNKSYKRIAALSDGTWQSAESDRPTNILRLTEAIAQEGNDGVHQVVFYDEGVGVDTSGTRNRFTGMTGAGLDENVKQLYTQIALNYDPGDELYLFGFSRGAYTARSLAGLIHACGLVPRSGLHDVHEAYEAYRTKNKELTKTFKKENGHVVIEALVCFDTVGALGVPSTIFGMPLPGEWRRAYEFHDVTLSDDIRNAIHVLSIDEDRAAYMPTRMRHSTNRPRSQVTSLFFWGVHSGVGGGKSGQEVCADITMRFVIDELARRDCGLSFNRDLIPPHFPEDVPEGEPRTRSRRTRFVKMFTGTDHRKVESVCQVHWSAVRHFQLNPSWRPPALRQLENEMKSCDWRKMMKKEVQRVSRRREI